ncbi:MAG: 30S ribosomal protein S13, partial [Candidatus Woesearchaeota archaeon]
MEGQKKEFNYIVRIANTDLDGNKPIVHALRKIKGISFMFANAVCKLSGVDTHQKTGYLTEDKINLIEDIIKNPIKHKAPSWVANRRRDPDDGLDKHLTGADLKFVQESDIRLMKKIRCYKGIRHSLGLPVRGQRTKSNFRKNKGKVMGVARSKQAKA